MKETVRPEGLPALVVSTANDKDRLAIAEELLSGSGTSHVLLSISNLGNAKVLR